MEIAAIALIIVQEAPLRGLHLGLSIRPQTLHSFILIHVFAFTLEQTLTNSSYDGHTLSTSDSVVLSSDTDTCKKDQHSIAAGMRCKLPKNYYFDSDFDDSKRLTF